MPISDCSNTVEVRNHVCDTSNDLEEMMTLSDDGTLTTNFNAKPIALLVKENVQNDLQALGIEYVWADATERNAQTGMSEGEQGYQSDTDEIYKYVSSVWTLFYTIGRDEYKTDVFRILDSTDNTKKISFVASQITTGQTRSITMPDYNVIVGGIKDKEIDDTAIGDNKILVYKTASGKYELEDKPVASLLGTLDTNNFLHIQDQKTPGTNGGTFTCGAWQTRDLNTVEKNTITGASLSSNQITLPAGDYHFKATSQALRVDRHKLRLYNVDDTISIAEGLNALKDSGSNDTVTQAFITGDFTLASSKTIELQHRCQTTKANDGYGIQMNTVFAVSAEIYTDIEIWKVG